jgi:hypothetical protein
MYYDGKNGKNVASPGFFYAFLTDILKNIGYSYQNSKKNGIFVF